MTARETLIRDDLDGAIDIHMMQGYRMEMIIPSDAPREVLMTKMSGEQIRLVSKNRQHSSNVDWSTGRVGMMYRDLIPDRLGGKLIASHIRIVDGGEVADSVHYHKIDFQLIYCLKGAIKVVYEDQGDALWLKPGDCVLQPPEIRHRVLEADAGSEVIELTSPAEHETWFDHELQLPNQSVDTARLFGSQRFVRHITSTSSDTSAKRTGIADATDGRFDVITLDMANGQEIVDVVERDDSISLEILINGKGIKVLIHKPLPN